MVPENCQIWVATHSIGFLRALQDELNEVSQIIEFKEDNKWASQAYTLTPMVKSRNNWRNLFETALDDLTGLVSPKCIVYCEDEQSQPARVENADLMQQCSIVFSAKNTQIHYLFRVVVIPNLINAAKLLSVFFQRCSQMSKYWF